MRRRFAAVAATAAGTTLVISLAGCGSDSGSSNGGIKLTAAEAVLKSSQVTSQSDSFRADVTVSTSGSSSTKIHATGQFRLKPTLAANATLDQFSTTGASIPLSGTRAILTDNVVYVKLPQVAQFLSGGKPWVKADLTQVGKQSGVDAVKALNDLQQRVNPADQTKMFTGSKDFHKVGTEDVDGVSTTHYTGTVTLQEALNQLDPQARKRINELGPANANDKINFDLWADKNQLPRKLISKGSANGDQGTVTVLYSDYGKSVSVDPPPADQVSSLDVGRLLAGRN